MSTVLVVRTSSAYCMKYLINLGWIFQIGGMAVLPRVRDVGRAGEEL